MLKPLVRIWVRREAIDAPGQGMDTAHMHTSFRSLVRLLALGLPRMEGDQELAVQVQQKEPVGTSAACNASQYTASLALQNDVSLANGARPNDILSTNG